MPQADCPAQAQVNLESRLNVIHLGWGLGNIGSAASQFLS